MNAQPTGIELTTKYFVLSFLIVIFPLTINIDGQDTKGKWGTNFYPVPAGTHTITVSWKAYWFLPVQKATTSVTISEGQVVRLQYYAPWFFLLPGKLTAARLSRCHATSVGGGRSKRRLPSGRVTMKPSDGSRTMLMIRLCTCL
ncbi:MAG: hypothetical protein QOG30_3141 [Acidimicrobiaceae bacterium]